jgi:hypothetical protein
MFLVEGPIFLESQQIHAGSFNFGHSYAFALKNP